MFTFYAIYRRPFNPKWFQRKCKRVSRFYTSENKAVNEILYGTRGKFNKGKGEYIVKEITINLLGYLVPILLLLTAGYFIINK